MRMKVTAFSLCSFLLLTGITYGAQTEVYGDFSVKPGRFIYYDMGMVQGTGTPRCSCDTGAIVQECPYNSFYSDTDQGEFCYDHFSPASRQYGRVDAPTFLNVAAGGQVEIGSGDIKISKMGSGIILQATNGSNCYRVTVDNAGVLHTTSVACP